VLSDAPLMTIDPNACAPQDLTLRKMAEIVWVSAHARDVQSFLGGYFGKTRLFPKTTFVKRFCTGKGKLLFTAI